MFAHILFTFFIILTQTSDDEDSVQRLIRQGALSPLPKLPGDKSPPTHKGLALRRSGSEPTLEIQDLASSPVEPTSADRTSAEPLQEPEPSTHTIDISLDDMLFAGSMTEEDVRRESAGWSNAYKKIADDEICSTKERIGPRGTQMSAQACRERCNMNPRCRFLAHWPTKKLCEIYVSCKERTPVNGARITLLERLTDCEEKLGKNMDGQYPRAIANEFPDDTLRSHGNNINFHCRCITMKIMLCGIFIVPGSEEEEVLNARFDPSRQLEMKPFFFLRGQGTPDDAIYFDEFGGSVKKIPSVVAEIELFLPEACISIQQCIEGNPKGVCPILKTPFQAGQPVYIRSEKIPDAIKGLPVVCVSLNGLNVLLEQQSASQKVKRQAGPTGNRHDLGYDMFWMFDEEVIKKGICGRAALPESPPAGGKKRRGGGKKKKKSTGSGSTPQGSSSSPDPFSPPASEMKPEEPDPGETADQDSAPEAAKIEPIVEGSQDAATKGEGDITRSVETIDTDIEVPPAPDTLSQQETILYFTFVESRW